MRQPSVDLAAARALRDPVARLLRHAASIAILPRFCRLRSADVSEKTPGEWVTVADHHAENILSEGLRAILSSARVVGEEASAAAPALLDDLSDGLAWIVDPLDGTANFAAGHGPFGMIVALVEDGETIAAWLFDPLAERLCFAVCGGGAEVRSADGSVRQLRVPVEPNPPVASLATQFMPAPTREALLGAAAAVFDVRPIPRCAAEHYPRLCLGEDHVALFQRTLPWDHAAGALLLTEAGGYVARWNGEPYRFHDDGVGILAASSRNLWDRAAAALLQDPALHADGARLIPQHIGRPQLPE
jgi:fructose-1,6-bisphosphatase/inositol monophosphatase family enzyme